MLALKKGFSWLWNGILTAEQVRAVGPQTVVFTLSQPYAPFLSTLTQLFVVNKDQVLANKKPGSYGDAGDYGEAYLGENVAGSGPYMKESWDHATTLVMKAFPGYWRGWKPNQITRVTYRTVQEEATMRTLLLGGQADMIDQWRTPTTFEQLKKTPGIVVDETPSAQLYHIELNTQRAPLSDVRVRGRPSRWLSTTRRPSTRSSRARSRRRARSRTASTGTARRSRPTPRTSSRRRRSWRTPASSRGSSRSTTGSRP